MSSSRRFVAASWPYLAVAVGFFGLRSAWAAILIYHAGIVYFARGGGRWGAIHEGRHGGWALVASLAAAAGGLLLYVLWPLAARTGSLEESFFRIGLHGTSWRLFAIYFVTVHPWLEELHWRGTLGDDRRRLVRTDLAFAGYHVPVLASFVEAPWIGVGVLPLLLASWSWRMLTARLGGLAVPFLSHAAADLSVVVAAQLLLSRA